MALGKRQGIKETIETINLHISMLKGAVTDMKRESVVPEVKKGASIKDFKVKRGQTVETKGILKFLVKSSNRLTKYVLGDKEMEDYDKVQISEQSRYINELSTKLLSVVDSLDVLKGRKAYNALTAIHEEVRLMKPIKYEKRRVR